MNVFTRFLEYLRYILFWTLDFFRGSKIRKHFSDIKKLLVDYPSSKGVREAYLENILQHSVNTTTYYGKYKNYKSLDDFPVINKNSIRNSLHSFESRTFKNKKNKLICTSGSTGAILKIKHNKNKVSRTTADTLYFSKKIGFKIGFKLFYFRHWNEYYKKSKLTALLQNIKPIEVLEINKNTVPDLIETVNKGASNSFWLGYASAFEQVCNYIDILKPKKINNNVSGIIAISEGLNNKTKIDLKNYFNAPVVSRYSNMENGIIAQQEIDSDYFTINWASFYIEIFKIDEDKLAIPGELGRIVITDLFNYCTPMIRYDTGDLGVIDYNSSPPIFKSIEGRKMDAILNTKGEVVSSFMMISNYAYSGIKQSQLMQEGKKLYILKLNVYNEFDQEQKLMLKLKDYLGKDAEIKIEYVNEIPLLDSGKRRITINNYSNKN